MSRPRTSRRSSRRAARAQRVRFLAGLVTVVLALVAAAVLGEKIHRTRLSPVLGTISGQPDPAQAGATPVSASEERKVYPYSIIEGGASTVDELKEAIASDPVVAEHFARFDLSKTRVETLAAPRLTHVSYRQGNDVFWTRKKVVIPAGETVLTDGKNIARTRCGNCLSETPGPVSAMEPAAAVLDTPISVPALKRAAAAPVGGQIPQLASAASGGSMGSSGSSSSRTGGIGGPFGSGGISGSRTGGAGSGGAPSGSLGLQSAGNETGDPGDPGDPGDLTSGGTGSGGSGGSGGQGSSGGSAGIGAPGDPQGPPNGPPSPPGNPSLPAGNPIVPPAFQGDPGEPLLPPIDSVLPSGGDPLDQPGDETPTAGVHAGLAGPGDPGEPGDPGDPGDPGNPGNPVGLVESSNPVNDIPEPGTTALMLLGGVYVVRRIRRTVP
jgi:hypothetical protein